MTEVPEKEIVYSHAENTSDLGEYPQGECFDEPLLDTIQRRVEELLSRQSLEDDSYIQQNMNAQMYIPLTTLASHYSIRSLGDVATVLSLVKTAVERSDKLLLDEKSSMARPCMKPRRNTLILHDLPDNFPEEELNALFARSPESEAFCSLKPDVNNTAFVSFQTDEAAQNAALWLRSQKLQGSDIKCAVKSEHFVRSFFPASPGIMSDGSPYMSSWGYPSPWMSGQDWNGIEQDWKEQNWSGSENYDASMNNMWWSDAGGWTMDASMAVDNGKGKGKGKGKGRRRGPGSFSLPDAQMEMLPRAELSQDAAQQPHGDDSDLVEPGYTHSYRKYSLQQIIDTCNAMEEILKPDSYERLEQNELALFRSSPCKDWAPPPNPLAAFANFFNEDKEGRGRDSQHADGNRRGSAASRKASWDPSDSMKARTQRDASQNPENKEDSWGNNDSSWWGKGQRSSSTKRSSSAARSWSRTRGVSWDHGYTNSDGGYSTPYWVKKENKGEDETQNDFLANAQSWPPVWVKKGASKPEEEDSKQDKDADDRDLSTRDSVDEQPKQPEETSTPKLSWAEKVKGVKPIESPKSKVSIASVAPSPSLPPAVETNSKIDSGKSPKNEKLSTANQRDKTPDKKAAPSPSVEKEGKASGTPTWADRMRQSISSK